MTQRPGARRLGAGILGAAAMISVITIASRLVGFGRWFAQAGALGVGGVSDAYATANQLPNIMFEIAAGGALAGAVVPLLSAPLARSMRGDVNRISSALLSWTLTILVPLAVVVAVLAPWIAGPLIGTSSGPLFDLTVTLLRMFVLQIPLYGMGVVLTGVLQAQKRFFWPAFAPLLSSLVVIGVYAGFWFATRDGDRNLGALSDQAVAWLGWGTTAGVAAMSLPLLIPVARTGVRLRPNWSFPEGVAVRAWRLAAAGVGAVIAQQAAALVVLKLANHYGGQGRGALNIYQYTQAVYFLPYAVLAVPVATSAFPRLADRVAHGDHVGFARLTAASTRTVLAVMACGVAALVAAGPAIAWVFASVERHGSHSIRDNQQEMGLAIAVMSLGLLGFALVFHLTRALYALEHGRAAVISAGIGWLTVIFASWIAVVALTSDGFDPGRTVVGLAIGSSVGMTVAGIAMIVAMTRVAGAASMRGVVRTVSIVVVGVAIGSIAGRLISDALVGAWGTGLTGAIAGGVSGGLVAAGLAAVAVWLGDRESWRAILHLESVADSLDSDSVGSEKTDDL